MEDSIKLFTSLKPTVMRKALFKATLIAGSGVLLLAMMGIFAPINILQIWGIPTIIIGSLLIALGMIPYKRLCRLELKPNEIIYIHGKYLQYLEKERVLITIPETCVKDIQYVEDENRYGIKLSIKAASEEKVIIHDEKIHSQAYMRTEAEGHSLFLPYFTKRAYARLFL